MLTLFLVGAGLTRTALRSIGIRPMLQGAVLWLAVSTLTLIALVTGLLPH